MLELININLLIIHVLVFNQVVPGNTELDIPWFATPVYTEEEVEMYNIGDDNHEDDKKRQSPPSLPADPRDWSRAEVCTWVTWMCSGHALPRPDIARFLMNGKAVCLMSVQMFSNRVPLGGKLLYRDFQIRLAKAVNNLKNT